MNERFKNYGGRKLPKESKTIPIKGYGDDEGKYYRCWHCGFICKVDRDSLGDRNSTHGVVLTNVSTPAVGNITRGRGMDISRWTVSPRADADGNPRTVVHTFNISGSGCPMCHTKNWPGDYP